MLPVLVALSAAQTYRGLPPEPIRLHPANGRYFLYDGKPTVLLTSGEHYGAVLNSAFDYVPYLDELQAHGLNLTRTFTGVYMEDAASFNIRNNTLAPKEGALICPWARSATPGYAHGGAKFDVTRWDERYFARLKDFCSEAGRRGIVVELVLFCPYYEDGMWHLSPLHPRNNVNGLPDVPRTEVLTLQHPELLAVQEAMVRKIAAELADAPNLYYEICNEPYFGGVTLEWQRRISATLAEAEAGLAHRHLIAQNIANGCAEVTDPDPRVSVWNFHYASPPDAVRVNRRLGQPIGFDETGFKGSEDGVYRMDAWDFLLAGGAVYDNLDYSFTVEHPGGTAEVSAPGGGSSALRRQLAALKRFIESFDFVNMAPDDDLVREGVPEGATVRALMRRTGAEYALYLRGGERATLALALPPGRYRAEWLNPRTGVADKTETIAAEAETTRLESPPYEEDLALALRATP